MANLHELLGMRDVALQDAADEYIRLWDLLRRIRDGEVKIEQVELKITPNGGRSWEVKEKAPETPMPERYVMPDEDNTKDE